MVLNYQKYDLIVSLAAPEKLVKCMKPIYMSCNKGISTSHIQKALTEPFSEDKVKAIIRRKVKDNPLTLIEDFVRNYDFLSKTDDIADFEK